MTEIARSTDAALSANAKKWLAILIVLGVIVRLVASYLQPGFADEAFVYYVTKAGFQAMVDVLRYDTHAPAYNMIMYPLIKVTSSIFILRLPAVILSALTIFLSFQLTRRFYSERAALYAAAFIAFSYSVWLTDAQLRTYGPLMLGLTAVWLGLINIYRGGTPFPELARPRWSWALFYLSAFLTATLHVTGTISLGALVLFCWGLPRSQRWKIAGGLLACTLPTLIWFVWARTQSTLPAAVADVSSYYLHFLVTPLYLLNGKAPNDIVYFCGYYSPSEYYDFYVIGAYLIANTLLWLLWGFGCFRLIRTYRWEGALLVGGSLLPLLAILSSCLLGMQAYAPRYGLTYTLPFLLAWGQALPRAAVRRAAQIALGWCLVLTLAFPFCTPLWNQYWQGAIDYIDSHAQPGDIICVYIPYASYTFAWAYDPQGIAFTFSNDAYYHVQVNQQDDGRHLPVTSLSQNQLNADFLARTSGHRVFLVLCQKYHGQGELDWLSQHFNIVGLVRFPSLTYWADVEVCTLMSKP